MKSIENMMTLCKKREAEFNGKVQAAKKQIEEAEKAKTIAEAKKEKAILAGNKGDFQTAKSEIEAAELATEWEAGQIKVIQGQRIVSIKECKQIESDIRKEYLTEAKRLYTEAMKSLEDAETALKALAELVETTNEAIRYLIVNALKSKQFSTDWGYDNQGLVHAAYRNVRENHSRIESWLKNRIADDVLCEKSIPYAEE